MFVKRSLEQYIADVDKYFQRALDAERRGDAKSADIWLDRAITLEAQALL